MDLLEDPRRSAHEGRLDDGEVLDDLVDPPVDRGREAELQAGGEQHLAEDVREREPEVLEVVLVQGARRLGGRALVDDAVLHEAHALGPAGRAGGVDDDGEAVGAERVDPVVDRRGAGFEQLTAAGREVVGRDHPAVLAAGSGERDDLAHAREVTAPLGQLGDLGLVLGEDDAALGVAEDVGDVVGDRRRVDGRRRAAAADDREVGENPLDPGRRRDGDAVLGLDPEGDQPGRPGTDHGVGLAPRERWPARPRRRGTRGMPLRPGCCATRSRKSAPTLGARSSSTRWLTVRSATACRGIRTPSSLQRTVLGVADRCPAPDDAIHRRRGPRPRPDGHRTVTRG